MSSSGWNGEEQGDGWEDVDDSAGGDQVRILPDSQEPPGSKQPRALQRGTLYTPAPEQQEPPSRSRRFQPYEPYGAGAQARRPTQPEPPPRQGYDGEEPQPSRRAPQEGKPEPVPVVVKRGPSACAILAGTFAVLALSCALLGFATFRGGLDGLGRLGGIFPQISFPLTSTVTINTNQPAVVSQVRSLSKLETVHYQMEKVVTGQSSGPLPEFLTSDKILLVAHGEVVAGLDLSRVQPEDITVITDAGRVIITLPQPQILYSKLDNDKTYVYNRSTGIFNKPDPNLETQIRRAAEQQIVQAALEDGILQKADENGRQVIRTLITGLGYKEVEFRDSR